MALAFADAAGTEHPPAGPDARIACLVPSLTELCVDLGLADRMVARTRYCIHPAKIVKDIPAVGGTKKASLTRLRAIAPSHVILNIDENTAEMAEALREFVPHVIVTHPLEPDDNLALYELIGGIFGAQDAAARIAEDYRAARAELDATADSLPRRDVVYFIWRDPWMTVSRDTYVAALIRLAKFHTLCHDPAVRYPEVAITPRLIKQTDLFLFSSEPYAYGQDDLDEFAAQFHCPAEKLRLVDGEMCSWYGSRAPRGVRYVKALAEAG